MNISLLHHWWFCWNSISMFHYFCIICIWLTIIAHKSSIIYWTPMHVLQSRPEKNNLAWYHNSDPSYWDQQQSNFYNPSVLLASVTLETLTALLLICRPEWQNNNNKTTWNVYHVKLWYQLAVIARVQMNITNILTVTEE